MKHRLLSGLFALTLALAACSAPVSQQGAEPPTELPSGSETPAPAPMPTEDGTAAEGSNILIAYFTWADNTVVDDPSAVDVDATASASVLIPGNAALMASYIQERVGGDLFSIRVTEPYSSDYDQCLDRAAEEKAENARPALEETVENMEDYDTVFLGFPNWWYTCPMAVFTFVEEHDLSGKTVVPFVAHGTGGLSSTVRDLTAALPEDTTVLEPVGIYRNDMPQAEEIIGQWLEGLGFDGPSPDTGEPETPGDGERQVRMEIGGQEVLVTLLDNPTANSLWEQIPLTLEFEDFNDTEKIAYPPEELSREGAPDTYDPGPGDVTVYGPWGNIAIFYQDFRDSAGLIPIGQVTSGLEFLQSQAGGFTARLERVQ